MSPMPRDQPEGLRRFSAERANATVRLVEQVLAVLGAEQAQLPPEQRQFPTSAIIAAAARLRPENPSLQRSTLSRNPEVQRRIAEARGETPPHQPDFRKYGGWAPPRGVSPRRRSRRRAVLTDWSILALAEHVAGLEELELHCAVRRQQFETVGWTSGPWPADQSYPSDPFQPSLTVLERYRRHQRRTRTELVRNALRLEQLVAEHRAHLLLFDYEYVRQLRADVGTR